MWRALTEALGKPELLHDPRLQDPAQYDAALAAEINGVIEAWTLRHTKFEVMRILGEMGVPCSACFNAVDIYADEHLRRRDMGVSVDHPTRGALHYARLPRQTQRFPRGVQPRRRCWDSTTPKCSPNS